MLLFTNNYFNMFSQIIRSVNLDVESSTDASDEFAKLSKQFEQSHLEYEDAKARLEETNKEINHYDEQLNIIERERVKLMSELALQMQMKHDLKNKVESLKNILQSTEFDLKKYNKMKLSTADLDIFSHTKKTFITYKNILKIYFDYSNGANATTQKGYTFNRITKKLAYFEFNTDEKTDNEIAECLWNKIKLVSDKTWEMLTE
ncbi:uncharacterized protein LOC100163924 [Acyrthosiphon pisum]|uniref:ACYPI004974 protein n=1 Tax=Acyrthosiphon pisum TaxID=7029 RepID=C4WVW8_ACYPI|nr:uncharacterized protein LOC100163924 [Acyrthosiphon pisum]BAH72038.1 ACYPI004974 [Acyrthosiphon pisum]|eukprot:NP_001232993.1 uncharacterized protein LOC100163924 [Acyrthosiphon pisum]